MKMNGRSAETFIAWKNAFEKEMREKALVEEKQLKDTKIMTQAEKDDFHAKVSLMKKIY